MEVELVVMKRNQPANHSLVQSTIDYNNYKLIDCKI